RGPHDLDLARQCGDGIKRGVGSDLRRGGADRPYNAHVVARAEVDAEVRDDGAWVKLVAGADLRPAVHVHDNGATVGNGNRHAGFKRCVGGRVEVDGVIDVDTGGAHRARHRTAMGAQFDRLAVVDDRHRRRGEAPHEYASGDGNSYDDKRQQPPQDG